MYTVYVLKSERRDFHYIGHSGALHTRLQRHNQGAVRSTKAYRPFRVIYTEQYPTRSAAYQREHYLKSPDGYFWLRAVLQQRGLW